ncbi:hypothetical protein [Pseudovibrio brasiliensis]|uniref:PH domain-containing protein n=1 Tax=Pseudovibrio brasiliensis TaxID=1898042 RepID=A0ABX8AG12_9HYPH|nr:hypothetical protein [Pseudovibrio brasiliensis]QUS54022.1 hypothetical protein KGB56_11285 [Pseudovibrio brasiliensis]
MNSEILDPHTGRSAINETPNGLSLEVPARKKPLQLIFLGVWLCMWAFGWISAFGTLLTGAAGFAGFFILFWLVAWTVGGLWVIGIFGWMAIGREIITFNTQGISIARKLGPFSRHWNCGAVHISELRTTEQPASSMFSNQMPLTFMSGAAHGTLKFDYGNRTLGFGLELETGEAKEILKLLLTRYPHLNKAKTS